MAAPEDVEVLDLTQDPRPELSLPEEIRLARACEDLRHGLFTTLIKAAGHWKVGYEKLKRRAKGGHSRAENGGNRTLLDATEELALQAWINLRLRCGQHSHCFFFYDIN